MVMVEYNVNCYDWRVAERDGKKLRRMRGKNLKWSDNERSTNNSVGKGEREKKGENGNTLLGERECGME